MPPGSRSLRSDERGQTLQDYVVGISIFLVVVFIALGFFPELLAGIQSTNIADNEAQADRVARQIVVNNTVPGTTNELNVSKIETMMDQSENQLRDRFNLTDTVSLNISFVPLNGTNGVFVENGTGTLLTSDPMYFGDEAGSAERIVKLSNASVRHCDPACRLEVRAW